jgi:hypothetical protein
LSILLLFHTKVVQLSLEASYLSWYAHLPPSHAKNDASRHTYCAALRSRHLSLTSPSRPRPCGPHQVLLRLS